MRTQAELTPDDLSQFTGTEMWYRYHKNILLTDGVKYFCDTVGGFWVIDIIFSVGNLINQEDFVYIELTVKNSKASIVFTDGDKGDGPVVLYKQKIPYTDCPEGVWKFYKEGQVILVPSEH